MELEPLLTAYIAEINAEHAQALAADLSARYTLLDVVRGLGEPLTQPDGAVRARATRCLVDFALHAPRTTASDTRVLAQFFSNRLEDADCVGEAATGLASINSAATAATFVPALDSAFYAQLSKVDMLALSAPARHGVYALLNVVPPTLVDDAFCQTFVSLAAGEKDPVNLLLVLRIAAKVAAASVSDENLKDLYNITFCYYPVKFHPPKDVEIEVTADDLKSALAEVLAQPKLAVFVLEGLLTKVGAINVAVKIDVYTMLARVIAGLKQENRLDERWMQVWNECKQEVLNMTRENDAYAAVLGLLRELATGPSADSFFEFLKSEFYEPEIPQYKLAQLVALVCELANEEAWASIGPLAVKTCLERAEPGLLAEIAGVPFATPEPERVVESLMEAKHYKGLVRFVDNPANPEYYASGVVIFLTKNEAYAALSELARVRPELVEEFALPLLFAALPGSLPVLGDICAVRSLALALVRETVPTLPRSDALSVLKTLRTALTAIPKEDLHGFSDELTIPLLQFLSTKRSDEILEAASRLLELISRAEESQTYAAQVLGFKDAVPFYVLFSCLAPLQDYPFGDLCIPDLSKCDFATRTTYLRLVALTANKQHWRAHFDALAPDSLDVAGLNADGDADISRIELTAWRLKGLLCRNAGFNEAVEFAQLALVNASVSKAFAVLVSPDRFLVKENLCVVRPLFRQRLYSLVLPILEKAGVDGLGSHALSSLIEFMPPAVVKSALPNSILILQTLLRSEVSRVQYIAVTTLSYTLPASFEHIALESVVPRVLELSTAAAFAGTRAECLLALVGLGLADRDAMAPYKEDVIKACVACLDDKKRSVRSNAASCRQLFTKF